MADNNDDNNDNITYLFNGQSIDGWSTAGKFVFLEYDESLQSSKPVGERNTFEIKAINQKYSVMLNGEKVIPKFIGNRSTEGYIGIQNHDADSHVSFKNIRIKEI
jgi:hypothetical protein